MAKKVCKLCRLFVTGATCPICHGATFTETWKGRLNIVNLEKSAIAKKLGITKNGEYAIKVR